MNLIRKNHQYRIFKKESKNSARYLMGIENGDKLRWFEFPVPPLSQGPMLVNAENVTRLFSASDHEDHEIAWLNFKGGISTEYPKVGNVIHPTKVRYSIFDEGTLQLGKQNDLHSELYLQGTKLSGRWILRKIPNVFDGLFDSKEVVLLWKPTKQSISPDQELQEVKCACPMDEAKSLNSTESFSIVPVKFQSEVDIDNETHMVQGVASAEGTWIDMFGRKFTYTSSFMDTLFQRIKENLPRMTMDMDHNGIDRGFVDEVSMVQEPIKYIVAKGRYSGSIEDVSGFSLEMTLKSVWSNTFQSWIPFDANPERLSLVGNPACKICWINQVN